MPSFRYGLLLCTTPMLLAPSAQAQSNSCELLKQTLSARIPPEIKGYAMDDVPARTPVPAGGKVIGTCEGGARKVIYRRFGGAPLASDGASGSVPAAPMPAPTPAPAPRPVASAPAPVVVQKEAPKPKPEPVVPTKPVAPPVASAPVAAAPKPAPAPPPAPVPAPVVRPPSVASAPTPVVMPAKPVVIEKPAEPLVVRAAPPTPAPQPAEAPKLSESLANDGNEPGFLSTHGHWLWLLLALPLVAGLWAWVSHRLAYDKAGLPRGPRL